MAILHPLKLVITNYPEGQIELMDIENNPENVKLWYKTSSFTKTLLY